MIDEKNFAFNEPLEDINLITEKDFMDKLISFFDSKDGEHQQTEIIEMIHNYFSLDSLLEWMRAREVEKKEMDKKGYESFDYPVLRNALEMNMTALVATRINNILTEYPNLFLRLKQDISAFLSSNGIVTAEVRRGAFELINGGQK